MDCSDKKAVNNNIAAILDDSTTSGLSNLDRMQAVCALTGVPPLWLRRSAPPPVIDPRLLHLPEGRAHIHARLNELLDDLADWRLCWPHPSAPSPADPATWAFLDEAVLKRRFVSWMYAALLDLRDLGGCVEAVYFRRFTDAVDGFRVWLRGYGYEGRDDEWVFLNYMGLMSVVDFACENEGELRAEWERVLLGDGKGEVQGVGKAV